VDRFGRKVKQGVNLRHGAVDAPARAHLAPVEDELLLDWTEPVHISSISVTSEITSIAANVNKLFKPANKPAGVQIIELKTRRV
jgi:hypothetical protein